MKRISRHCNWLIVAFALAAWAYSSIASAQDAPATTAADENAEALAGNELSIDQAKLADRYERLEIVLGRLAELSASTDPRRAKVLREAIARSREEGIEDRFETIVLLLEGERLSAAAGRQTDLQKELDALLALLLKADRDRELDSERKRIKAYLKEVGRLIRLERGIQARTEGGDDPQRLAQDQKQVGDETGKLGESIRDTEKKGTTNKDAESAESKAGNSSKSDAKEGQSPSQKKSSQDGKSNQQESKQGSGEKKAGEESKSGAGRPSDRQPSEGQKSQDGQQGKLGQEGQGQQSQSQQGKQSQQGQQGQQGQSGPSGNSSEGEQQPQEPTDRAAEKLKQAQQAMQEAHQKLEELERKGASEAQQEALRQLEQAKAELERVLRQLREEEMERTLTLLAARFRKMLDAQTQVWEATVRVHNIPAADRDHDEEIETARLSREETVIAREAERALVLLREEGSSMAFPETVSLIHDDMLEVAELLNKGKVAERTQGLEGDIIESLEEMIAALDKAIKDLEKKKTPAGQSPPAGQPGDPPLVDKIAELKMIRALQMRINRRTLRYDRLMQDEPAEAPSLRNDLLDLAERQQRVYQATHDLAHGVND